MRRGMQCVPEMREDDPLTLWAMDFVKNEDKPVFPLRGTVDERKKPAVKWNTTEKPSKKSDLMRHWFNGKPGRGFAVPCGDDFVVIDCDLPNAVIKTNGVHEFEQICRDFGETPSPVRQRTQSGGVHFFYRANPDIPVANDTKIVYLNRRCNIDVRSNGGYVVVCSPRTMKKEDGEEKLDIEGYPQISNAYERIVPEGMDAPPRLDSAPVLPKWLAEMLAKEAAVQEIADFRTAVLNGAEFIRKSQEGCRNDLLNKTMFYFARVYAENSEAMELAEREFTEAALAAGLGRDEVERTIKSAIGDGAAKAVPVDRLPYIFRKKPDAEAEAIVVDEPREEQPKTRETHTGLASPPPLDALSPKLANIVRTVAKSKNTPEEIAFGVLLALGSACIGRARGIVYQESNDWVEFANLYIMVISETGTGKSHLMKYMFRHLERIERKAKAKWRKEQKEYELAMQEWRKKNKNRSVQEAMKDVPEKPVNIHYIIDDATFEAIVERLEDNPRGLFWMVDELNHWFEGLDRYNKSGGETKRKMLSVWESNKISYTRKSHQGVSNETYLTNATIGLFGNLQPGLLGSFFTLNDVAQGWPHRFLYIRARMMSPARYPIPDIPPEIDADLKLITERLVGLDLRLSDTGFLEPSYVTLSPAAKDYLDAFMDNLSVTSFGTSVRGYAAKLNKITMRIALILHFMEWAVNSEAMEAPTVVDPSTIHSAIMVVQWFMEHTRIVQSYLPTYAQAKGGKKVKDSSTNDIIIAKMIVNHEDEIREKEGIIPNALWKEWLEKDKVYLNDKVVGFTLQRLGVELWHNRATRGKKIDNTVLELCMDIISTKKVWTEEIENDGF